MKKTLLYNLLLATPSLVLAATPTDLKSLLDIFTGEILNSVIGLLSAFAVIFFVLGIVRYIANAGDEKKAKEGKSIMWYGLLGLFVLFSFWGIVQFVHTDIFGN